MTVTTLGGRGDTFPLPDTCVSSLFLNQIIQMFQAACTEQHRYYQRNHKSWREEGVNGLFRCSVVSWLSTSPLKPCPPAATLMMAITGEPDDYFRTALSIFFHFYFYVWDCRPIPSAIKSQSEQMCDTGMPQRRWLFTVHRKTNAQRPTQMWLRASWMRETGWYAVICPNMTI